MPLPAINLEIKRLVSMLSAGNQSEFARCVAKCSPSKISQILSGSQKPTMEIIKNIAKHKDVDSESLLALWHSCFTPSATMVPVASALIPGFASANKKFLSGQKVDVPPTLFSNSLYGIRAQIIQPHPDPRFEPNDILLVDSDPQPFAANLNILIGRTVVVKESNGNVATARLSRVLAINGRKITVEVCGAETLNQPLQFGEREPRRMRFSSKDQSRKTKSSHGDRNSKTQSKKTGVSELTIQFKQVVGVVVLMMRGF